MLSKGLILVVGVLCLAIPLLVSCGQARRSAAFLSGEGWTEESTRLAFKDPYSDDDGWRPHWISVWSWVGDNPSNSATISYRFSLKNAHLPVFPSNDPERFPRLGYFYIPEFSPPSHDFKQSILRLSETIREADEEHRSIPVIFAFQGEPQLSEIQTNKEYSASEHLDYLCLDVGMTWALENQGLIIYEPRLRD
jgi:hypothetical protein